jgi:hypothetical protein
MSKKTMPSKLLWILWLLVSIFGVTVGLTIGINLMGDDWTFRPFFVLFGLVIGGLLIGFGQWVLLRTRINQSWKWIPTYAIGLPLGIFIGFLARNNLIIMCTAAGFFVGLFQWIALDRKKESPFRWIVVSVLSWGIGLPTALLIFEVYLWNTDFGFGNYPNLGILIGTIVGTINGAFVDSVLINSKYEGP